MADVIEILNEENFEKEIKEGLPVIVDFWATWCYPCGLQSPIIDEYKKEVGDKIKVLKVDVDKIPDLANKYEIFSIPTLLFILNGEVVGKKVGLTEKKEIAETTEQLFKL